MRPRRLRGDPVAEGACALIGALGFLLGASTALATEIPSVEARLAGGSIVVDGDLSDSAWSAASRLNLVQQDPHPGEPTAFITDVRVLVDSERLYLGVRCEDPDPQHLAVHSLEFDADRNDDDHVTVVLDTLGNHRVGYVFELSAGAARSDGLISPASPEPSYDWNGNWIAKVRRDASGWTAEMAIDVHALQFRTGAPTWGLNVRRYVPRERLNLQWSGTSLDASVFDLSRAGVLSGVGGFVAGGRYTFTPYALTRIDNLGRPVTGQAGVDVRYDVSPELATIFTVNPDFAETEADAAQINLTRFSLFLPEKRRFFLEGSNQFSFSAGLGENFIPFYSRRVGLVEERAVRIDEGVKVIGQAGALGIGALDVQTGAGAGRGPNNLFAGHFTYDIDEHLRIGTLLTRGDPDSERDNAFAGVDAVWHSSTFLDEKNLTLAGWAARSGGDLLPGQRTGYGVYADYPNDLWHWTILANEFGEALDPALGFLPRPGTRQFDGYVQYAPRPQRSWLSWARQFFYELEFTQVDGLDGQTQSRRVFTAPFNVSTTSGAHFEANWIPQYERLDAPFEIAHGVTIAPGAYHFNRFRVELESSPATDWHYGVSTRFGEFFDGRLLEVRPYLYWTGLDHRLRLELNNETDVAHLPEGNFTQRLWQLKASYGFTPDLNLASYLQYDSEFGHVGINTRLRWIFGPSRELFLVFNHGVETSVGDLERPENRSSNALIAKLRWEFR